MKVKRVIVSKKYVDENNAESEVTVIVEPNGPTRDEALLAMAESEILITQWLGSDIEGEEEEEFANADEKLEDEI